MKRSITIGVALLLLSAVSAVEAQDAPFAKKLDELIPKLGAEKIPDRHSAQQTLLDACLQLGAPGKEQQRAEACKAIAQKLNAEMTTPARIWLLKQLEHIGRAECVDAVGKLLNDKDPLVRDAARRALANNPEETAGAKLLAAMQSTGDDKFKVALINSLGFRADATSVKALTAELASKNQAVAIAAARALGKIATPAAAKALAAAHAKADGELKTWIGDSWLLCADNFVKQGKSAEAAAIYKKLSQSKVGPLRLAALQGLLKISKSSKTK